MRDPERLFCPVRKKVVVARPNGRYWYCLACGGWHRLLRCPRTNAAAEAVLWGIDIRTGEASWLCSDCWEWHTLEQGGDGL